MSSDENDTNLGRGLSALLKDIQSNAQGVDHAGEIEVLQDRINTIETMVEEVGRARELQDTLQEYVSDLKDEVKDIRKYRFWVTFFSTTMSITLFGLLIACMIYTPAWFLALEGNLQVPLIIALGGGSVFLMSLNLRGVYRSRHERNHGDFLPEPVKAGLEAFRKLQG